jgi:hypothetical protein
MENTVPLDAAASSLPLSGAPGHGDRATAADRGNTFRRALSRVAGRWWQIVLLWLGLFLPVCPLSSVFIQPTYEASSLLRIEPNVFECFGPIRQPAPAHVQRQMGLITGDQVIKSAIADPQVAELTTIKSWVNPKN